MAVACLSDTNVSPLIYRVLTRGRPFGDEAPTWLRAVRSEDARKAREKVVKRLRRFADDFPDAAQLAKTLEDCRPGHRCMSGACPECGRALQRWFVGQAQKLASAHPTDLWAVSVAFAEDRAPEDRLHTLHTTRILKGLRYVLGKSSDISWAAGGIDLSLNDDTQKGGNTSWVPQFYGFVATPNIAVLTDLLRKRYPKTEQSPRPVRIVECDGSTKALSYAFKPAFVRRISYKDTGHHGRWDTRKVSLSPKHHVQAMLWQYQNGFSGRLFFQQLRTTRVGQHVELVTIKQRK